MGSSRALSAVLGLLAWPLGKFLAALCEGRLPQWMHAIETAVPLAGVAPDQSMHWRSYALALLAFNANRGVRGVRPAEIPTSAAAQPSRNGVGDCRFLVQYGGEFRDQYQLARLCR